MRPQSQGWSKGVLLCVQEVPANVGSPFVHETVKSQFNYIARYKQGLKEDVKIYCANVAQHVAVSGGASPQQPWPCSFAEALGHLAGLSPVESKLTSHLWVFTFGLQDLWRAPS